MTMLPPRIKGLGISVFSKITKFKYLNSRLATKTLTRKIINQERQYERDSKIKQIKKNKWSDTPAPQQCTEKHKK